MAAKMSRLVRTIYNAKSEGIDGLALASHFVANDTVL